jgi:hypothetical protein
MVQGMAPSCFIIIIIIIIIYGYPIVLTPFVEKIIYYCQVQCPTPVILATQEAEIRRIMV